MVEGCQQLRLALETSQAFRVGQEVGGEDLDRDLTLEGGVLRPVDLSHCPGAQFAEDLDGVAARARAAGVPAASIAVDPGIGFAKTAETCLLGSSRRSPEVLCPDDFVPEMGHRSNQWYAVVVYMKEGPAQPITAWTSEPRARGLVFWLRERLESEPH